MGSSFPHNPSAYNTSQHVALHVVVTMIDYDFDSVFLQTFLIFYCNLVREKANRNSLPKPNSLEL